MEIPANRFKHAIVEGRQQVGIWSQLASSIAAEVIAGAGFDFIVIDTEHAPNDVVTAVPQLQVIQNGSTGAILRLPWNDMVLSKRFLDIGAQTLLVPFVQSPEEAAEAVRNTRYPPAGVRGVATVHRANRFGRVTDYYQRAAAETCVLVQVETEQSVGRIEEIAAVDGVDGVFIGPSDLAASMGHIGDPKHAAVQETIAQALEGAKRAGKPAGILTPIEADARRYLDMGYTFIALGSDIGLLATQSAALAAKFV